MPTPKQVKSDIAAFLNADDKVAARTAIGAASASDLAAKADTLTRLAATMTLTDAQVFVVGLGESSPVLGLPAWSKDYNGETYVALYAASGKWTLELNQVGNVVHDWVSVEDAATTAPQDCTWTARSGLASSASVAVEIYSPNVGFEELRNLPTAVTTISGTNTGDEDTETILAKLSGPNETEDDARIGAEYMPDALSGAGVPVVGGSTPAAIIVGGVNNGLLLPQNGTANGKPTFGNGASHFVSNHFIQWSSGSWQLYVNTFFVGNGVGDTTYPWEADWVSYNPFDVDETSVSGNATPASHIGQLYHDTENDVWYRWDGSAWQADAGGANLTAESIGTALGYTPADADDVPTNPGDIDAEPALGNPDTNGKVLSSTTGGTRSWITPSGTVGNAAVNAAIEEDPAATREAALTNKRPGLSRIGEKLWQINRGNVGSPTATIVALGDSMASRVPLAIANELAQRHGVKGLAMDSVQYTKGPGVTSSPDNVGSPENFNWWPSGKYFEIDAGEFVTFSQPLSGIANFLTIDSISIYIAGTGASGTCKIQTSLNGSTWADVATIGTINANTGGADAAVIATGTVTKGFYMVRILGVSGTVHFLGAKIWDSTAKGVIPCLIGRGGCTLSQQNQSAAGNVFPPIMLDINPDLVMVQQRDGLVTYQEQYPLLLANWRNAGLTPSWSLFGNADMEADHTVAKNERAAIAKVAETYSTHYFDSNAALGGWQGIVDSGLGSTDLIHLDPEAWPVLAAAWIADTGLHTVVNTKHIRRRYSNLFDSYVLSGGSTGTQSTNFTLEGSATGNCEITLGNNSTDGRPYNPSWTFRRVSSANATFPDALQIIGGAITDTRFTMDASGRSAFYSTGVGQSWPRAERLFVGELSPSHSALRLHHAGDPTTGRALKITNASDEETAFIRANGTAKLTLPTYADDAAAILTLACARTNNSGVVTTSDTSQITVGMNVSGTGAQANTIVTKVTNATTFGISLVAIGTGTNDWTISLPAGELYKTSTGELRIKL